MMPVFEVINPNTGHRYQIYADGRIKGFGDATIVINRIMLMAYSGRLDTPSQITPHAAGS